MRILFVVAISQERFNCIPDIGQGYLASCARSAGHEVRLLDCLLEGYDYDDFAGYVKSYRPEVLGIKTYSCDIGCVAEMARIVRQVSPRTVIVIGGPHPSCEVPQRLFGQFPDVDYAFAGEAEPGFASFLQRTASNRTDMSDIPGLIWKDSTGIVRANERAWVKNLDSLPFPAWDLIDPRRYRWGYSFMTSKLPAAPMAMTRGCPYSCTFCGSHLISGRRVRKRSGDSILAEMKLLKRDYGVRAIDIVDENFAFDGNFVREFCERLLSERLDIAWNCPYGVRLDSLDEDLVRLMARSGCFGLSVGVESGSQRVLDSVKKQLKIEEITEKVRMIKRVSTIMVQGYFIIGFPDETHDEIEATIRLACSLPFDLVTFCPLRVTPGTEIYSDLLSSGKIVRDLDYQGLGHHQFVRSYCSIPDDEMRKLYRRAYTQFYFRPRVVLNLLGQVRSAAQLRTITNGLLRMVRVPKRSRACQA